MANPADAQDLLMEAALIVEFIQSMVTQASENAERSIPLGQCLGLPYILQDVRDRLEKADLIIDTYKEQMKEIEKAKKS